MPKRFSPGLLLSAIVLLCLCSALGYLALQRAGSARETGRLTAFASQLGYQPEAQLAQYDNCWGIFLTECGEVLYYATSLPLDAFQAKLALAAPAVGTPKLVDGFTLLEVNAASDHTLSINGETDPLAGVGISEPRAYGWLDREGGEHWVIRFYETAQDGQMYHIDNRPIAGNIVTVMLRTK